MGDVNATIRANTEAFDAAMRAGNTDAFMAFYADDAVLMPPNAPAFNGAANVRQFWGGLLAAGKTDVDLTTEDVIASGDLAVERGRFEVTVPFKDSGKYIVVLALPRRKVAVSIRRHLQFQSRGSGAIIRGVGLTFVVGTAADVFAGELARAVERRCTRFAFSANAEENMSRSRWMRRGGASCSGASIRRSTSRRT